MKNSDNSIYIVEDTYMCYIHRPSLHVNKAIKNRSFFILKFHMSIVNRSLLQMYTLDCQYDI